MHRSSGGRRRARTLTALAVALTVATTACGTDPAADPPPSPGATPSPAGGVTAAGEGTFPITIETADGPVEVPARPEAIVSLSATATEVLFAIGAGDQVVAVDDQSDFPDGVPTTDLSGHQPNVEAIAAFDPDLVIAAGDPGDLVASLGALDIPVLVHPAAPTLDDAWTQLEQTAAATGHVAEAAALVAALQGEIDDVVAAAPAAEGLTYYHELDPSHYSVTGSTFIGQVYGLFGLQSIADAAEDDNGGYPRLSPEFVVDADPDLVFLADGECCDVTADDVVARPGWDTITAVRDGAITTLDEDVASRWGPRVVDLVHAVADALAARVPAA